jgi:hypothetical protein
MKLKSKVVAGLVATAALAFGIAAQADMGQGCDRERGPGMMRERMKMGGDPAARVDKHLSRYKSELRITPEQEPLWQAFADKVKAQAGQGMKAMRERAQEPLPAPERMARMIEAAKARIPAMEAIAASFGNLYDKLTPEQKAIADKHHVFGLHRGPRPAAGGKPPRGKEGPAEHKH